MVRGLLLLGVCVLVAGPLRADAKADALKALQGDWTCVSLEFGGEKVPADKVPKLTLTFKGDEVTPSDHPSDVARVTLDPAKSPAWFDLTDKKETLPGIYKLEGDTLTICSGEADKDRPTEFASPKGTKVGLLVLKRAGK